MKTLIDLEKQRVKMQNAELSPSIAVISPDNQMKYNNLWLFKDGNDEREKEEEKKGMLWNADETKPFEQNKLRNENCILFVLNSRRDDEKKNFGRLVSADEWITWYSMHLNRTKGKKRSREIRRKQMDMMTFCCEWYFWILVFSLCFLFYCIMHR